MIRRALLPLSWVYGAAVACRNRRYQRDPSLAARLPVSVLSVGNLTTGGSGKTPLVAALARELLSRGLPVAALSRGYGRRSRSSFVLVSDGKRISATPEEAGDEPYELASIVSGLAVGVGADRFDAGLRLLDALGPHVILLDDGFQHRRLHRDLDLVCLDAEEPTASLRLLPAGRLREPVASLARAHALVWTRWREGRPSDELRALVAGAAGGDLVQIRARHRVAGWSRVDVDEGETCGAAPQGPIGLVLGVARPERVLETITPDVVFRAFRPDHHWWELAEVRTLAEEAKRRGAKALLTTEKDAVKMLGWRKAGGFELALPLFATRIESEVLDRPELYALLDRLSAP